MKKVKKFVGRLVSDYIYGSVFFAIIGFAINFVYALWQTGLAVHFRSVWYIVLACYYIVLFVIRGFTLLFKKLSVKYTGIVKLKKTLKYYRFIGIMLFVLNIIFAFIAWYTISTGTVTHYSAISAIASAAYAFYKITLAIINAVRAKKYDDFVIRALRKLTLTDAIVSLFVMSAAMVETFGDGIRGTLFPLVAACGIAATGGCLVITVYMMVNASINLKKASAIENTEK